MTKKQRRKKVVKQISPFTATPSTGLAGWLPQYEHKAVKVGEDIADKLNEAFGDGWRISQHFTFTTKQWSLSSAGSENNVVVVLEREKRG